MKKLLVILWLLALVFMSNAQSTHPATVLRFGTANPSSCKPTGANVFYRTDTGTLYVCTATNTWTAVGGGASSVTVGSSVISSGTTTRVLFDNAGVLGEYPITGTTNVVMSSSPTIASPTVTGTATFVKTVNTPVSLTDNGSSIATDASLGNNFRTTALTANVTLSNPTNATNGQIITWEIIQHASAAKTLAFDTKFAFGAEITGCTISTTTASHDFITVQYNSTADKFYVRGCITGY